MNFINGKTFIQVQYCDFEIDEWTIPALLTAGRAARLVNDCSVKTIKLIFNNTFKYLVP